MIELHSVNVPPASTSTSGAVPPGTTPASASVPRRVSEAPVWTEIPADDTGPNELHQLPLAEPPKVQTLAPVPTTRPDVQLLQYPLTYPQRPWKSDS